MLVKLAIYWHERALITPMNARFDLYNKLLIDFRSYSAFYYTLEVVSRPFKTFQNVSRPFKTFLDLFRLFLIVIKKIFPIPNGLQKVFLPVKLTSQRRPFQDIS